MAGRDSTEAHSQRPSPTGRGWIWLEAAFVQHPQIVPACAVLVQPYGASPLPRQPAGAIYLK